MVPLEALLFWKSIASSSIDALILKLIWLNASIAKVTSVKSVRSQWSHMNSCYITLGSLPQQWTEFMSEIRAWRIFSPEFPLPLMAGPPLQLHIDPSATPVAVHKVAQEPLHWRAQVKEDIERDVRLGVLEKVPYNTPVTWQAHMVVTAKDNGDQRRTIY